MGQWNSIQQIVDDFDLATPASDLATIRTALIRRLAELHPDRTGGDFVGETERQHFEKISEAIEFIDKIGQTQQALLVIARASPPLLALGGDDLERRVQRAARETVRRRSRFPKLSAAVFGALAAAAWSFPGQVTQHPILDEFVAAKLPDQELADLRAIEEILTDTTTNLSCDDFELLAGRVSRAERPGACAADVDTRKQSPRAVDIDIRSSFLSESTRILRSIQRQYDVVILQESAAEVRVAVVNSVRRRLSLFVSSVAFVLMASCGFFAFMHWLADRYVEEEIEHISTEAGFIEIAANLKSGSRDGMFDFSAVVALLSARSASRRVALAPAWVAEDVARGLITRMIERGVIERAGSSGFGSATFKFIA